MTGPVACSIVEDGDTVRAALLFETSVGLDRIDHETSDGLFALTRGEPEVHTSRRFAQGRVVEQPHLDALTMPCAIADEWNLDGQTDPLVIFDAQGENAVRRTLTPDEYARTAIVILPDDHVEMGQVRINVPPRVGRRPFVPKAPHPVPDEVMGDVTTYVIGPRDPPFWGAVLFWAVVPSPRPSMW